ncbi:MAG: hypothetical protein NVSMB42_22810 [Herpetosiphon sp.]
MQNPLSKLLNFLEQLDKAKLSYHLEHVRDSIMAVVAVPGARWEIEFFVDGHIEVEQFSSPGKIEGEDVLERLIMLHAD